MTPTSSPWGKVQTVEHIAPGIVSVTTPGHGGVMLDAAHVAKIPRAIGTGYSGSRAAWEEDCDWAIPYLLWPVEFANWGPVRRLGAEKVSEHARNAIKYNPGWSAYFDARDSQPTLAA